MSIMGRALREAPKEEFRPYIACACGGCRVSATIRHKHNDEWLNVCREHYEKLISLEASEWCKKNGFHTLQQKIDFCKGRMANVFKEAA